MKQILITLFLLNTLFVNSQGVEIYYDAIIVTEEGIFNYLIKLKGGYSEEILYKKRKSSKVKKLDINIVKSINTKYNSYAKIIYKGKSFLPRIICLGRINFYEYQSFTSPKGWNKHQDDIVTYYIEKGNVVFELKAGMIPNEIEELFYDNENIKNKLKIEEIHIVEFAKLINEYNKSFESK